MTRRHLVLANSPVVGPLTMRTLGAALAERGADTDVPPAPFDVHEYVSVVAGALTDSSILVAFSAAGPRSFAVAAARRPAGIVFLDARLPDDGVAPSDERAFAELLDGLPLDDAGRFPPWPAWWGDEVVRAICPDDRLRARFVDECPPVPRTVFDVPVPAPPFDGPCAFLAFGDGYADQRAVAAERGWPTTTLDQAHLGALVAPDDTAEALLGLIDRMDVA